MSDRPREYARRARRKVEKNKRTAIADRHGIATFKNIKITDVEHKLLGGERIGRRHHSQHNRRITVSVARFRSGHVGLVVEGVTSKILVLLNDTQSRLLIGDIRRRRGGGR